MPGDLTPTTGPSVGKGMSSVPGVTAMEMAGEISDQFLKVGIDPAVALNLAQKEGALTNGAYIGDKSIGGSYGPFQLHHPGLRDLFEKETGLDATDPKTWREQIKWTANFVAKRGSWGHDWATSMGKLGYAPNRGIGYGSHRSSSATGSPNLDPTNPFANPATAGSGFHWDNLLQRRVPNGASLSSMSNTHHVTTSSSSNEMHIGKIDINAPHATDANGIAGEFGPALARHGFAAMANYGQA